jgi:hypothetical protein
MNKTAAKAKIEEAIEKLGIPAHLVQIRNIPSMVECSLVVGNQHLKFSARSGVTETDLNTQLEKISEAWHAKLAQGKQVDIEDAIEVLGDTAKAMAGAL